MSDTAASAERAPAATRPTPVSHLIGEPRRAPRRWPERLLVGLFLGYLALGKGFAYFGVPPVFVGEVALVLLVLAAIRSDLVLPTGPSAAVAAVVVVGGAVHAAVDLLYDDVSPIETLRGFAIVYYAVFAVLVTGALRAREDTASAEQIADRLCRTLARSMVVVVPLLTLLSVRLIGVMVPSPVWPGSGIPVLITKATDIGVGLAFSLPLVWHSLVTARRTRRAVLSASCVAALWSVSAALVATRSRGAVLALAVALLFTFGLHARTVARVIFGLALAWIALRVSGFRLQVAQRELSARGLTDAVVTVLRPDASSDPSYSLTTQWRARWWSAILRDAWSDRWWFRGPGWGTNLATRYQISDQYVAAQEFVALRLPHNFVIGLVGRVGFVLAALFVTVPALALLRTRPRRLPGLLAAHPLRTAVQAGIVAQIAVGLTDVYLESPQGAIVFWMQLGVLWWMSATRPQAGSATAAS